MEAEEEAQLKTLWTDATAEMGLYRSCEHLSVCHVYLCVTFHINVIDTNVTFMCVSRLFVCYFNMAFMCVSRLFVCNVYLSVT